MIAKSEQRQYLATFILNLLCISFGASCGWSSPAVLELSSDTTPLLPSGPITPTEASWIGSLHSLGAIVGTLLFGTLADKIGRKPCLLISAVPYTISWVLLIIAKDVLTLCISRFICGVGAGGMFLVIPMFIQEIADDRIRGRLGSSIVLSCNFGTLVMFVLANYFSYSVYSSVFIVCPTSFFFLALCYLPETPKRLVATNKLAAAEKSFRFYRNDKNYSLSNLMQSSASFNHCDGSCDDTKNVPSMKKRSLWHDLKTRSVRKAFVIGTMMMWFNQFCGLFTMMTFAGTIFKESGSSFSPNMSSIVVGVIQLLGSYCSTICVDRFGRKILLASSGFGIALGLSGLGLYIYCKDELLMDLENVAWISLVCFCFPIFIGNCGIMALPFLIVSEIFPQRITRIAFTYCMVLIHTLCFLAVKFFPIISDMVGPQYCFFFFSACALIGALFSIFGMPETKGRSIDEIEKLMSK